jgi:hypothetical protein
LEDGAVRNWLKFWKLDISFLEEKNKILYQFEEDNQSKKREKTRSPIFSYLRKCFVPFILKMNNFLDRPVKKNYTNAKNQSF